MVKRILHSFQENFPQFLEFPAISMKILGEFPATFIKSKKYANFRYKLGKLAIQTKDDYYINLKNTKIGKI